MHGIASQPRGIARLARALGLDSNPLQRASDRAGAYLRIGLVAIFLIAGPLAVQGAGRWAYHAEITGGTLQALRTHRVNAVPLQPAVAIADPVDANGSRLAGPGARWEGARSSARSGEVLAGALALALMALALLATLRLTAMFLNLWVPKCVLNARRT
jgi:hypothetical protein